MAVKVTDWPIVDGLSEEVSAVLVGAVAAEKSAITDFGPFMRRICGLVVPVRSPENPVNTYPALGVAVILTVLPASNQLPAVTAPAPPGLTDVINWNCVANRA